MNHPPLRRDQKRSQRRAGSIIRGLRADPGTDFSRFFTGPNRQRNSINFRKPPKPSLGTKKESRAPRDRFITDVHAFLAPIVQHFYDFSENIQKQRSSCGSSEASIYLDLPPQKYNVFQAVSFIFHIVSTTPPGSIFYRFYADFWLQRPICACPRAPPGVQNPPSGTHFSEKCRQK